MLRFLIVNYFNNKIKLQVEKVRRLPYKQGKLGCLPKHYVVFNAIPNVTFLHTVYIFVRLFYPYVDLFVVRVKNPTDTKYNSLDLYSSKI